jgi:hypothetical protein
VRPRIPPWLAAFLASRVLLWSGVLFAFLWFTPNVITRQQPHDLGYGLD